MYPDTLEVLADQSNATLCWTVVAPVPESDTVAGEPVASLEIVRVPVTAPAEVGANCTVIVVFCEGVRLTAEFGTLKPVPVAETLAIFTVEFPVLVTVTLSDDEVPVLTLPKLKLVGLTVIVFVDAAPDPLSEIANGDPGALLVRLSVAVTFPLAVGANFTVKLLVFPAVIVSGSVRPVVENSCDPDTEACEIVKLAVPVFFS